MTNEAFQALLARGPVLLDGATGSNLMRAGMPRGICTEVWVTEHPEPLLALQRDYIAAGSQIIYAPTFCANRRGLARCGRENDVALLNRQLVALSREAAGGHAFVAGDLTTTGVPLEPAGTMTYHELFEIYTEQITALAEAGARPARRGDHARHRRDDRRPRGGAERLRPAGPVQHDGAGRRQRLFRRDLCRGRGDAAGTRRGRRRHQLLPPARTSLKALCAI